MTARRGQVRRDVDRAAAKLSLGDEHAALLQLARQYATVLDDARFWADQARLAAIELGDAPERGDYRRLQAVEKAVDSARVVASIGPRLLAVLQALRSAGAAAPSQPAGGASDDPARGKLLRLRARRAGGRH